MGDLMIKKLAIYALCLTVGALFTFLVFGSMVLSGVSAPVASCIVLPLFMFSGLAAEALTE